MDGYTQHIYTSTDALASNIGVKFMPNPYTAREQETERERETLAFKWLDDVAEILLSSCRNYRISSPSLNFSNHARVAFGTHFSFFTVLIMNVKNLRN